MFYFKNKFIIIMYYNKLKMSIENEINDIYDIYEETPDIKFIIENEFNDVYRTNEYLRMVYLQTLERLYNIDDGNNKNILTSFVS